MWSSSYRGSYQGFGDGQDGAMGDEVSDAAVAEHGLVGTSEGRCG